MGKTPNFKESRSARTRLGSNFIGITKNGAISVYTGFYRKNQIERFSHCILLVDREQNIIGIQFGDKELGNGAYTLNNNINNKTACISAGNFFKINGFNISDWYGKYEAKIFDDGVRKNVFMMDLDEKIPTNRKSKS